MHCYTLLKLVRPAWRRIFARVYSQYGPTVIKTICERACTLCTVCTVLDQLITKIVLNHGIFTNSRPTIFSSLMHILKSVMWCTSSLCTVWWCTRKPHFASSCSLGLASCMLQENRRKKQNSIFNQPQNDTCTTLIHGGAKEEQELNLSSIRSWGCCCCYACVLEWQEYIRSTMKYTAIHFTRWKLIGIHLNRLKCIHLSCVRGGVSCWRVVFMG